MSFGKFSYFTAGLYTLEQIRFMLSKFKGLNYLFVQIKPSESKIEAACLLNSVARKVNMGMPFIEHVPSSMLHYDIRVYRSLCPSGI